MNNLIKLAMVTAIVAISTIVTAGTCKVSITTGGANPLVVEGIKGETAVKVESKDNSHKVSILMTEIKKETGATHTWTALNATDKFEDFFKVYMKDVKAGVVLSAGTKEMTLGTSGSVDLKGDFFSSDYAQKWEGANKQSAADKKSFAIVSARATTDTGFKSGTYTDNGILMFCAATFDEIDDKKHAAIIDHGSKGADDKEKIKFFKGEETKLAGAEQSVCSLGTSATAETGTAEKAAAWLKVSDAVSTITLYFMGVDFNGMNKVSDIYGVVPSLFSADGLGKDDKTKLGSSAIFSATNVAKVEVVLVDSLKK